jgi:predicted CXXCH cytochrome family protein
MVKKIEEGQVEMILYNVFKNPLCLSLKDLMRDLMLLFFVHGLLIILSGIASAGIVGSKHDFSGEKWNEEGKVCQPCHYQSTADMKISPLWNQGVAVDPYTLYNGTTRKVAPKSPRSITKFCLSCHDGSISPERNNLIGGKAKIGTVFDNDHPVSIRWRHQNNNGNVNCPNCHGIHDASINSELPFFGGYIECATCHDIHNKTGYPKLLRKPQQNSEICLHCHVR